MNETLKAVAEYCRTHFGLSGGEEAQSMVESFLRTFDVCASRLKGQLDEMDFGEVQDIGQDIGGFAVDSGAVELTRLARELVSCARSCDAEETASAIRRILALHRACHANAPS